MKATLALLARLAPGSSSSQRMQLPLTRRLTSPSSWKPCSIREVSLPGPFTTALGDTISEIKVKVELHGGHSSAPARTVLIFPSFSHSSHVSSNTDDPSPGWWEDIVGPSKAVDTRHWRVVCISVVGSPFSATQPAAIDLSTGRPYRASFPQISPTDVARVHRAVLEQIGINEPVHAAIGASFGGMQVLQYASLFPDMVKRIVAIACTGRTTPFTMLVRRMQRRAILSDPGYHGCVFYTATSDPNTLTVSLRHMRVVYSRVLHEPCMILLCSGNYADFKTGPWEGLKQAREFGTLFYRYCAMIRATSRDSVSYCTTPPSEYDPCYSPNLLFQISRRI
jgi:homoserine acetyltransferase